jgi:hypothetical protein
MKQEIMYSEEEIDSVISDFKHDLRESTSTYVKQLCEGAIFGLERLKNTKEISKNMTEEFNYSLVECDICRIMWVAVRPIETLELECPNCNHMTSIKGGDK